MTKTGEFLQRFHQHHPEAATLAAFLVLGASDPARVQATDFARLHQQFPNTRDITEERFRAVADPEAHRRMAGPCFGPIRPSGRRPTELVFDRRLNVLAWLDDQGRPTWAPKGTLPSRLRIVGPLEAPADGSVTYIFAQRQSEIDRQRVLELAGRLVTDEALRAAPSARSAFDNCQLTDVALEQGEQRRARGPGILQRVAGTVAATIEAQATSAAYDAASNAVVRVIKP